MNKIIRTLLLLTFMAGYGHMQAQDVMVISKTNGKDVRFNANNVDSVFYESVYSLPYSNALNGEQGNFSVLDKTKPAGFASVWKGDSRYSCMKASGYANSQKYATESWLISPKVGLLNTTSATLTFEHAGKYFQDITQEVSVYVRGDNGVWEQQTINAFPTNFSFVKATIDLSKYLGQAVEVAFVYTSTSTSAGTWEVKNVSITGSSNPSTNPDTPPTGVNGYVEVPFITDTQRAKEELKYIQHSFNYGGKEVRSYEMLYDTTLKMAYWVAYPLCAFYTKKNGERTNAWGYDPKLPESKQSTMKKGLGHGYDRGHQIPSADRLVTEESNNQTFYYTNMTPQLSGLNQRTWQQLETALRSKYMPTTDTLYVVTGAMPTTAENTTITYMKDNKGVDIAIPKYYFKAICALNRTTGEAKTLAFKIDHKATNDNYMNYVISVAELERLTGFTFFPSIDPKYKKSTSW